MKTLALVIRERVNYARTGAAALSVHVQTMPMGTCNWFKRIPAKAASPPGVLEMV